MSKEKIVLFGASITGEKVYNKIKKKHNIVAFCDNDTAKQGNVFCGIKVVSPSALQDIEYNKIIIVSSYEMEIKKQLVEMGINNFESYRIDIHTVNEKLHNKSISVSEYYDEMSRYLETYDVYGNQRIDRIKYRLGSFINEQDSVLDIGCGNGITSEYISGLTNNRVLGIDISEKMIEFAKERGSKAEFLCADIISLDLEAKFNKITMFDCLEHIPRENYSILFRKMKNYLDEKGVIVFTIPDPNLIKFLRKTDPHSLQIIDNDVTIEEIHSLCNQNNLEIKSYNVFSIGGNVYNEYVLIHQLAWV